MTVHLLIGTRKGGFIATSDAGRREWSLQGPFLKGHEVNHVAHVGGGRFVMAGKSAWWGPALQISDDAGRTWRETGAVRFGEGRGHSVERIWFIKADPRVQDRLYAGVDPGALFVSDDRGDSWREVPSLTDHPTRAKWSPGAGGLMVHSIVFDPSRPARLTVGVSAAGVFRSDDGGASWAPRNAGVRADFLPEREPLVGQCVHHLEMHPQRPDVLYQQNHCGVYRSDNGGDTWTDISSGLPSRFGFPFAALPRDGNTVFVIPEESDQVRTTANGALGIFRSRDCGVSWEPLTEGLPQTAAYSNVMRMAMTVDTLESAGVYVGTQGGQILASRDGGDRWSILFNWLPPIYSLETVVS
jgi:photosystem II stability/assembly factor-like uncharacterized protein